MPRKKHWRKSVVKKVVKADGGGSSGSQFSDVGLTNLTDCEESVPQSGTCEPGSYNISDVGMTCPLVTSDPMTSKNQTDPKSHNLSSDTSKNHIESSCSQKDCEKRLQNELNCTCMNNNSEAKKSEKELWSKTDLYTATSVDSNRYASSRQDGSSKVPCKTIVLGSYNQADHMFSDQSHGSQCSVNALCSLIIAKFSHLGTGHCLDKVLLEGDILYNKVISGLKAQGLFKTKLLSLDEIPEAVTILEKDIIVEKFDVISGVCTQQFAFQKSSYLLFMIGSVCSAVFKSKDGYCFFILIHMEQMACHALKDSLY